MPVKLSEKYVERLPYAERAVEHYDSAVTGFGVRCGKQSKSYFVFGRLPSGVNFKHKLGRCDILDFSEAQDEARNILRDASRGIHPKNRPNVSGAKIDKQTQFSLDSMLDEYTAARKKTKQATKDEYRAWLERNVKEWMHVHMATITPAMVLQRHAEIGKRSPAQANGCFRIVRALYNYAMEVYEDDIPRNPVRRLASVKAWYPTRRKRTFIRPSQMPAVFAALQAHPCIQSDYLKVLLFTGVRSASEIAALKIKDVHLADRTMWLWDTKTTDLYIPICDTVTEILTRRIEQAKKAGKEFIFYSNRGQTGHIGDVRNKIKAILKGTGIDFSPHDLRRTWITYAEELGIEKFVRQGLVGHAVQGDVHDGYTILTTERLRIAAEQIERFILQRAGRLPDVPTS